MADRRGGPPNPRSERGGPPALFTRLCVLHYMHAGKHVRRRLDGHCVHLLSQLAPAPVAGDRASLGVTERHPSAERSADA
jgi:hypothetical protein